MVKGTIYRTASYSNPATEAGTPATQSGVNCQYCNKTVANARNLTPHIVSQHTDERAHLCPFQECPYATKGFALKEGLQRYITRVHESDNPTEPATPPQRAVPRIEQVSEEPQTEKSEGEVLRDRMRETQAIIDSQQRVMDEQIDTIEEQATVIKKQQARLRN
ncbi:hypothetical protein GE09DRAFT_1285499 [Coniochaeta sp. 2T2.1]|nr:hypothetical protein GE09DRAFT_1285499 [Coniochaeta sp. 2T2.1]